MKEQQVVEAKLREVRAEVYTKGYKYAPPLRHVLRAVDAALVWVLERSGPEPIALLVEQAKGTVGQQIADAHVGRANVDANVDLGAAWMLQRDVDEAIDRCVRAELDRCLGLVDEVLRARGRDRDADTLRDRMARGVRPGDDS